VADAHDLLLLRERIFDELLGRSSSPISSSIFITFVFAPPCRGPESAAMAAVTAPYTSASVPATTRAVKVEAFSS
jgi:hypothetical protein